jgi:hypothetical protein
MMGTSPEEYLDFYLPMQLDPIIGGNQAHYGWRYKIKLVLIGRVVLMRLLDD